MGPLCSSYTAKIYNNNGILITSANSTDKQSARRMALINLENIRYRDNQLPISYNSRGIFDSVKIQ
jgi:hypothetical protein